jgi:hypothetical protein
MHSKIYQITEKKLERDDYTKAANFDYDDHSDFADYIDDVERDEEKELLEHFDSLFEGIFSRKGRTITLLDTSGFIEEWRSAIKKCADNMDFTDWRTLFQMREITKRTHKEHNTMLYTDHAGFEYFGEFVQRLYAAHKPGDKFYIGGILDYHW